MEYKPNTKNAVCSSRTSTLAYAISESASTSMLSSHYPPFSVPTSSRSRRTIRSSLKFLTGCLLIFSCLLVSVHANINCAQPTAGGNYKAGDPIVLHWGSDGASPTVAQITSLTAKLYCDSGILIEQVKIIDWTTAFTWAVPSVGNATTAGGTEGTCSANAFHMEYEGTYKSLLIDRGFGPVRCGTITIAPAPNGTVTPTTTTTTKAPTSTSTSTTTKTKSSTDASSSPTESSNNKEESGGKIDTYIIVIVAIAAFVILVLVAVGAMFYLRKQRIKRMESAIMPWSNQPNNQFSKMSSNSLDEDPGAPSNSGGRSPGIAAAAAAGAGMYGSNKPQPSVPQPSHVQGYYHDDGYGYGNQRQQGYSHDDYNHAAKDEYYNPHYLQDAAHTGHHHQNPHQIYGSSPASMTPPYYNGSRTPYQDPKDPFQQQQQQKGAAIGGYFPPPPPVTSNVNEVSGVMSPPPASSMISIPHSTGSSVLTTSPSLRRGPQVILPEMGGREENNDIPMKKLT